MIEPIARAIRGLLFRGAHVSAVKVVSPHFRLIELAGGAIENGKWAAGQHIQVIVGSGLAKRTFTPMSWNAEGTRLSILVFLHGEGPGCEWMRNAKANDACEIMGPRPSFKIPGYGARLVLFGDETCFGLAVGLSHAMGAENVRCVFEVADVSESGFVLERFGLGQAILIQRSEDRAHLNRVNAEIADWARDGAQFALAGNARSIQVVKKYLAASGVGSSRVKVKPYWSPGKKGLD